MTIYFYQATDRSGKFIEGNIEAPDYRFAVQKIRNLNYLPIQVSEDQPSKTISLGGDFHNSKKSL